jgi:hypothetical protein
MLVSLKGSSILSEVDDTSILRTGLAQRVSSDQKGGEVLAKIRRHSLLDRSFHFHPVENRRVEQPRVQPIVGSNLIQYKPRIVK